MHNTEQSASADEQKDGRYNGRHRIDEKTHLHRCPSCKRDFDCTNQSCDSFKGTLCKACWIFEAIKPPPPDMTVPNRYRE